MTKLSSWVGAVGLVAGVTVAVAAVIPHSATAASAAKSSHLFAGHLAKPFDAMSASELSALAARLSFTGGATRARMCSGTPECDSGIARTSAHIEAVDEAPISASNIPAEGVIITRFENTGKFTERRYGLAPSAVAYLIALPRTDTTAVGRWMLVQIAGDTKKVLASGAIASCGHGTYPGKPQADFRSCVSAATAHRQGMTINSASFPGDASDPIWTVCAVGCCIF
jgi:hypothetical protein